MRKEAGQSITEATTGMPKPQFLDIIPSLFESGKKPIGIIVKSPIDGQEKPFIWWRNLHSDLDTEESRNAVATYVTRLMLSYGAEVIIGSAVDLMSSDVKNGRVKVLPKSGNRGQYGYYVEASKRLWFGVNASLGGPSTVDELIIDLSGKGKPDLFDEIYGKIEASLPRSSVIARKK